MNTHEIASRIAEILKGYFGSPSYNAAVIGTGRIDVAIKIAADAIATELDKELKPMEEERDKWKRLYDAECELNWTAGLCDRLNSLVRENRKHFISECKGGPSACDLVTQIHGQFNLAQGDITQLRAQLAEAQKERDDAKRHHDEFGKAVEKRLDSLEPKIENLVQERDELKAQLAAEQEKGRKAKEALLNLIRRCTTCGGLTGTYRATAWGAQDATEQKCHICSEARATLRELEEK